MAADSNDPALGALLIVDDEPAILDLVTRVCEATGYRCLQADDGAEALKLFQRNRADIAAIMTDVNMPGMDGLTLIRAVREAAPEAKIILSSGSLGEAEQRVAAGIGVTAFLPKPYTVAQLMACIRSVVGE
jgi:two-component system, cell cycle sensor histidine kinase and response regulator CckA